MKDIFIYRGHLGTISMKNRKPAKSKHIFREKRDKNLTLILHFQEFVMSN